MQTPVFFKSVNELHKQFQKNHNKIADLWIGFYTVKPGKKAATYKEAVDEALCFGWIDGIRKNVDENSYAIRFTPRKKRSICSNVNTKRIKGLIKEGCVHKNDLAVFEEPSEASVGIYSLEQKKHKFPPMFEKKFKAM